MMRLIGILTGSAIAVGIFDRLHCRNTGVSKQRGTEAKARLGETLVTQIRSISETVGCIEPGTRDGYCAAEPARRNWRPIPEPVVMAPDIASKLCAQRSRTRANGYRLKR